MANFSALFPNLQDNLDFTVGSASGNDNQIYGWAQANDTTVIPLAKLPRLQLGHTHLATATDTTAADALASYVAAFNTAGTANNGITVTVGTVIDAGDILILTYNTNDIETYLFTGGQETATSDGATSTIAASEFRDVTTAEGGVSSVAGGTNLNTTGGATTGNVTVNLDAAIGGITSINNASTDALTIGHATLASAGNLTLNGDTLDINVNDGGLDVDVAAGGMNFLATDGNVLLQTNGASSSATIQATSAVIQNATGLTASRVTCNNDGVTIIATGVGDDVSITANDEVNIAGVTARLRTGNAAADASVQVSATGVAIAAPGAADTVAITANATGNISLGATANITLPSSGNESFLSVDSSGNIHTNASIAPGTYTFNTIVDGATGSIPTTQHNGVFLIADQSQAIDITIANATAAGTWIKIINNSGRPDVNLSGTFLETADDDIVLNDTSANLELIWTGTAGWAIISS